VNSPPPIQKRSFIVTLGLLTGMAAFTVDVSLPAVPAMVEALTTSLSRGQQIVGIFMFGMAFGQIPAGLVSDRVGRLPVLYAGMALFLVGAIASAIADSIEVMLIGRFVQGFGSAPAIVLSRAIVRDISSGKAAAKLMSLMTMIFTVAPVIAPSVGALLVTQWGWRAPFIIIVFLGVLITFGVYRYIDETHTPDAGQHPVRQLKSSFSEFFSHRQSIFGLLLIILPPAGFMSMIALAAALVDRLLVTRLDSMQIIAIGVALYGISGVSLLIMAWLNSASFVLLWGSMCLFMASVAIVMPNATVIALDPLPKIAGVASSIIGTTQNIIGASGAFLGAAIYNGTVRNSVVIMGTVGVLVVLVYLLRPILCPQVVHHPDELARD